jgi:phage-related protein
MPDQRTVEFDFIGQAEKLVKTLENIEQHIRRVPEEKNVNIKAKTAQARKDIDVLQAELRKLTLEEHDVKVQMRLRELAGDVARAKALIATLPERRTLTYRFRETIFGRLSNAARLTENAVGRVDNIIKGVGETATDTASKVFDFEGALSSFGGSLRRLGPLVTGLSIAIVAALIPGLIALGAAFGGAIAGAGALAVALGGALVPAIVAAVGVFGRFGAVLDVFKQKQQAAQQATKDSGQAAQDAAQREVTLRNARRALGDASRQVVRAEQALQQARAQARENIAAAEQRLADARKSAADAAQDLARAEVDAFKQIKQAVEDASDAVRDYKQSKLDAQGAKLDTEQAQLDLKQLREELGLFGAEFDNTIKKFNEGNIDASKLGAALDSAARAATGKGLSAQDRIDLERAVLRVKDAKLGEAKATDDVKDAEKKANDTATEAERLKKTGIKGVQSYADALDRNKEAQKHLNDATKDYNDLVGKGVEGAPEVIAAHQQIADAVRNEKRQQQDLKTAKEKLDTSLGDDAAAKRAKDAFDKLSPAEQNLERALERFKKRWDTFWKTAATPVVNAVADIINNINALLPGIQGPMAELTKIFGEQITKIFQGIQTPKNLENLSTVFGNLKKIIGDVGTIVVNVFGTLANVAAAASPALKDLFHDFAAWTGHLKDATTDTGKLKKKIDPMIEAFRLFASIGVEAIKAVINVFSADPKGLNDFLKFLRDGLRDFNKWASSKKGREEIKRFFDKTLPLVEQIIRLLVNVGKGIANLFETLGPILTPVLDKINDFFDGLNKVWGVINKLTGPISGFFSTITAAVSPLGIVATLSKTFGDALSKLASGDVLGAIKSAGKDLYDAFIKPFVDAFNWIKDHLGPGKLSVIATGGFNGLMITVAGFGDDIVNAIAGPFKKAFGAIPGIFNDAKNAVQTGWDAITHIFSVAWEKIHGLVTKVAGAAADIAGGIVSAFEGIGPLIETALSGIGTAVEAVLNVVIDMINAFGNGLDKVSGLINKIPGVPDIPDIPDIPHVSLKEGGIATKRIFAELGEAGREAVLPLTQSVYRELGKAISDAMVTTVQVKRPATPLAAMAGPSSVTNVDKIQVITPTGAPMDPTVAAVKMARLLERRGGGTRG